MFPKSANHSQPSSTQKYKKPRHNKPKPSEPQYTEKLPLTSYLKPRSTAWRTTWLVMLVVLFSMIMSIVFFWRSLYLPEIKQHSYYLANEINLLNDAALALVSTPVAENPSSNITPEEQYQWLVSHMSFEIVTDPEKFPRVSEKFIAEIFTDEFEKSLSKNLGMPVTVFFKFKPTPNLWVQLPNTMPNAWIKQPVTHYANYSPTLILAWLLGTPLLSLVAILLLTRQINRPLERMRRAARQYLKTGHTESLQTSHGPIEVRQVNQAFNQLFSTLEQNEKERTVMLAGISHDLRTPLTRMRLTAEMLPDEFFKEGLVYDIEDMEDILEQFISFMRDGSDEPVQFTDLDEIFHEIMVQFSPLSFQYTPADPALPKLMLRSLSIKRMIVNLVSNARKYGAEPVMLAAYLHDDTIPADPTDSKSLPYKQRQLHISVKDSGDGIAETDIENLMQPFTRGEQARTMQGSGLGLAIVGRIAKLHQGSVKIRNHPQGGLEVKVVIPLEAS